MYIWEQKDENSDKGKGGKGRTIFETWKRSRAREAQCAHKNSRVEPSLEQNGAKPGQGGTEGKGHVGGEKSKEEKGRKTVSNLGLGGLQPT